MGQGKYRQALPQLSGHPFITDGGLETVMIYLRGFQLPSFAAFDLLKDAGGQGALRQYYTEYCALAHRYSTGFILDTPTWRSNPDWGQKIGYSAEDLARFNRQAVELMQAIREKEETPATPIVLNGVVGPRGDGYQADKRMTAEEAETYHEPQIRIFEDAGVDMISAITMTYPEEAIGIVWAAAQAGLPVVISFTVETDGRLPTGQTLEAAIAEVDESTDNGPAYYMVNCAHPSHFSQAIDAGAPWLKRVRGLRSNASKKSHAELDQSTELDIGDMAELSQMTADLRAKWPNLTILGGCCGTDARHIEDMLKACLTPAK
jgi:S-methylmethionine-dependent homocysteine/selenocysteine methylase